MYECASFYFGRCRSSVVNMTQTSRKSSYIQVVFPCLDKEVILRHTTHFSVDFLLSSIHLGTVNGERSHVSDKDMPVYPSAWPTMYVTLLQKKECLFTNCCFMIHAVECFSVRAISGQSKLNHCRNKNYNVVSNVDTVRR